MGKAERLFSSETAVYGGDVCVCVCVLHRSMQLIHLNLLIHSSIQTNETTRHRQTQIERWGRKGKQERQNEEKELLQILLQLHTYITYSIITMTCSYMLNLMTLHINTHNCDYYIGIS